jgi:hypothetical protein
MVIGRNHIFASLTVHSGRQFALLAPISFKRTTAQAADLAHSRFDLKYQAIFLLFDLFDIHAGDFFQVID